MPWSEIVPLLLTSILAAIPVALPQHLPLPPRLALVLWQSWVCCRHGFLPWMKLLRLMFCALTKPEL